MKRSQYDLSGLTPAGHMCKIELCEIANLIHPCDIWNEAVERKVQGENFDMCVDSGEGWTEVSKMVKWNNGL